MGLGKIFGGTKTSTSSTTQTSGPNIQQWMKDLQDQLVKGGMSATEAMRATSPEERFAGFTPDEIAAQEAVRAAQGQYTPYTQKALELASQAQQKAFEGVSPEDIQKFMSPYQQAVTDVAKREAIRQADIQRGGIQDAAARAGAFGGARHGVVESEANRNLQQQLTDIQTRGSQDAYSQALNAARQSYLDAISGGTNIAGIAGQSQGIGYRDISALSTSGQEQRGLEQAKRDFAFTNPLQSYLQGQQVLSSALPTYGTTGTTTQTQQTPTSGWLSKLAGGLISVGSLGAPGGGTVGGNLLSSWLPGASGGTAGGFGPIGTSNVDLGGDSGLFGGYKVNTKFADGGSVETPQGLADAVRAVAEMNKGAAEGISRTELPMGDQGSEGGNGGSPDMGQLVSLAMKVAPYFLADGGNVQTPKETPKPSLSNYEKIVNKADNVLANLAKEGKEGVVKASEFTASSMNKAPSIIEQLKSSPAIKALNPAHPLNIALMAIDANETAGPELDEVQPVKKADGGLADYNSGDRGPLSPFANKGKMSGLDLLDPKIQSLLEGPKAIVAAKESSQVAPPLAPPSSEDLAQVPSKSPLEKAATTNTSEQEANRIGRELVNEQAQAPSPETDKFQDILNKMHESLTPKQQEEQKQQKEGFLENANLPLLKLGLTLMGSDKPFFEAMGEAGNAMTGQIQAERTAKATSIAQDKEAKANAQKALFEGMKWVAEQQEKQRHNLAGEKIRETTAEAYAKQSARSGQLQAKMTPVEKSKVSILEAQLKDLPDLEVEEAKYAYDQAAKDAIKKKYEDKKTDLQRELTSLWNAVDARTTGIAPTPTSPTPSPVAPPPASTAAPAASGGKQLHFDAKGNIIR